MEIDESSKARMKVMTKPMATLGAISGKMTRENARRRDAPNDLAAASSSQSAPWNPLDTTRTQYGDAWIVSAITRGTRPGCHPIWVSPTNAAKAKMVDGMISGESRNDMIADLNRI